ncbi:hypothetical protein ACFSE0_06775 [Ochrobactrum teleogrylli]|uniref:hypothetical protein n=1 Tax=Ochrobactrum teleogrylli TaxID=2479765 RepID=UPI001AEE0925|nr:hypothetical protein [[Ochrobactrum] teleogrylli]
MTGELGHRSRHCVKSYVKNFGKCLNRAQRVEERLGIRISKFVKQIAEIRNADLLHDRHCLWFVLQSSFHVVGGALDVRGEPRTADE